VPTALRAFIVTVCEEGLPPIAFYVMAKDSEQAKARARRIARTKKAATCESVAA
jgi:hypothetical protein